MESNKINQNVAENNLTEMILSQQYDANTIDIQNGKIISISQQLYLRAGSRRHKTNYALPLINKYQVNHQFYGETIIYQLSSGKINENNDDGIDQELIKPSKRTKRIAVIRKMPTEIGKILNTKINVLEKHVMDYRYPGKMNKVALRIQREKKRIRMNRSNRRTTTKSTQTSIAPLPTAALTPLPMSSVPMPAPLSGSAPMPAPLPGSAPMPAPLPGSAPLPNVAPLPGSAPMPVPLPIVAPLPGAAPMPAPLPGTASMAPPLSGAAPLPKSVAVPAPPPFPPTDAPPPLGVPPPFPSLPGTLIPFPGPAVVLKRKKPVKSLKPDSDENIMKLMEVKNDESEFKKCGVRINDLVDPSLNCELKNDKKDFYWIPSIFNVSKCGQVTIKSDINNLSRILYPNLYNIIQSVFKYMIPMFEWILNINSLNDRDLNVIVKMQNYELYENSIYNAELHREGDIKQNNIVAVGIYFYDKSEFIEQDIFEIAHKFTKSSGCGGSRTVQITEKISINKNDLIVFNNNNGILHRLEILKNGSNELIANRKILAFFVIDPNQQNVKTSKDILVNKFEKYHLIILYWFRELIVVGNISIDLIKLIMYFVCNIDIIKQRQIRDVMKIKQILLAAQNQYGGRRMD